MLSIAIKNFLLVFVIIMILHVLISNHLEDIRKGTRLGSKINRTLAAAVAEAAAEAKVEAKAIPMAAHEAYDNIVGSESNTGTTSASDTVDEAGAGAGAEEGLKDMLEFVYGCKDDGSGDFCPTNMEIMQHKEQLKKEIISKPGESISVPFKEDVIGVYKNENIMNGGKIDNGLNGWDMVYSNYGTI